MPGTKKCFCEPCNKDFPSQEALNAHLATHEQCHFLDCTFVASHKVVQAHFHSAHGQYSGTGLKTVEIEGQQFRVLLGTSPEEVSAWRAERRARFPTPMRTQARSEDLQRLQEAGGVLPATTSKKRALPQGSDDAKGVRACKFFAMGRCRKGGRCPLAHDQALRQQSAAGPAKERKPALSDCLQKNLLLRLTERERLAEENLLLQALHHIGTAASAFPTACHASRNNSERSLSRSDAGGCVGWLLVT